MAVIQGLLVQGAQRALVLLLAPLLIGFVRKVKARLLRRRGAPVPAGCRVHADGAYQGYEQGCSVLGTNGV